MLLIIPVPRSGLLLSLLRTQCSTGGRFSSGEEIIPNTTDGAFEKHVPVISQKGDTVTVAVGSVAHPMLDVHYIEWIVLETATGYQKKDLKPGDKPEADFAVTEPVIAAYEYCNLHGLWKAEG